MKWEDLPIPNAALLNITMKTDLTRAKALTTALKTCLKGAHGRILELCADLIDCEHMVCAHFIGSTVGLYSSVWFKLTLKATGTTLASVDSFDKNSRDVTLPNLVRLLRTLAQLVDRALEMNGFSGIERDATIYVEQAAVAVAKAVIETRTTVDAYERVKAAAKASVPRLVITFVGAADASRRVYIGDTERAFDPGANALDFVDAKADAAVLDDLFHNDACNTFLAVTRMGESGNFQGMTYFIKTIVVHDPEAGIDPYLYVFELVDVAIDVRISGATDAMQAQACILSDLFEQLNVCVNMMRSRIRDVYRIGGVEAATTADPLQRIVFDDAPDEDDPEYKMDAEDTTDMECDSEVADLNPDWDDDDVPLAERRQSLPAAAEASSSAKKRPGGEVAITGAQRNKH